MTALSNYFQKQKWGTARILKGIIALLALLNYLYTQDNLFLFVSIFLWVQVLFNIACPGGSCTTAKSTDDKKAVMKFKTYDPGKKDI